MKIESLWTYPIKSCAGISLHKAEVTRGGIKWDRNWMIVDAATGGFMTQRQLPKMALIQTELTSSALVVRIDNYAFEVPFEKELKVRRMVKVWKNEVEALIEDPLIDHQLSGFLGKPVQLVRSSGSQRQHHIHFADGRPLQLANTESLIALNRQLPNLVTMDRFRANIVVSGIPAFEEEKISEFRFGDLILKFSKLCTRCNIINVDPKTGERKSSETLEKLKKFHSEGNQAVFGVLLIPKSPGTLSIS